MFRNILVAGALIFGTTLSAQEVRKVQIGDNQNFGITYTLPQTEILATVQAVSSKTMAGIYAPYAEKYLGLSDVATTDQTVWEITSIALEGVPVPDKSRTFAIDFSEKGSLPQFYLSKDGMLLSINCEPEVAAKAEEATEAEEPKKLSLKATDVLTEDILKAGSKAKQAELTAREIFSIRESRSELLKGEVENMPKDGASYQIVLDNLNAQEQALLSLFVGTTTVTKTKKTFRLTPADEVDSRVFFRFSTYLGFVDDDDLVGEPYYLTVKITDDSRVKESVAGDDRKKEKGIAYNVAGKAHVALSFDGETIAEGDMPMAQFGHVVQLPANSFTDKKNPASAQFNPLTGSITFYK